MDWCTVKQYEYIRLPLDMGDLRELNVLSGVGWRVVTVVYERGPFSRENYALLEREIDPLHRGVNA
jgi:hypothetical protein